MANRKPTRSSKKSKKNGGLRDTFKVLAFAQLILLFCAGAIPEPLKFLAFGPVLAVIGAGVFWSVSTGIAFVREHARLGVATENPAAAPVSARSRTRPTKVVKISKIA